MIREFLHRDKLWKLQKKDLNKFNAASFEYLGIHSL